MKLTNAVVSVTTAALACASLTTSAWHHSWLALGATMALFTATEIVRGAAQGHQVGVAAYLARHPPASAAQVSSALGLRPRTAASALSNLVADGLAVRHPATADSDATTFKPEPLTPPPNGTDTCVPHKATLTNHHADSSICPKEHRHTVTGKPTHPDCPGRAYTRGACTCGWDFECPGKGYVSEERKRHLATHPGPTPGGPKVLRDLLRLDAE